MKQIRKCKYCNQIFDNVNNGVFLNHVKWCKCNPNREKYLNKLTEIRQNYRVGHSSWNKGLTKETDYRIADKTTKLKQRYSSGELKGSWVDRHHTEETKRKLSEIGRNNPYQRKCKKTLPYTKLDGTIVNLDSSYERLVAKFLDDNHIEWSRPQALIWIDKQNKEHNYFPDFYLPQLDIYLDPKNDYCFKVQQEKIEYIKANYPNVIFLSKEWLNHDKLEKLLRSLGWE